jgi:hypothetical protein
MSLSFSAFMTFCKPMMFSCSSSCQWRAQDLSNYGRFRRGCIEWLVSIAHLEEHDFSEGALGVGVILEGVEDLLKSHGFLRLLVH